jgi:hypothetical protein
MSGPPEGLWNTPDGPWRFAVLQWWSRPKISFCEIFGVVQFSTFATNADRRSGSGQISHAGSTASDRYRGADKAGYFGWGCAFGLHGARLLHRVVSQGRALGRPSAGLHDHRVCPVARHQRRSHRQRLKPCQTAHRQGSMRCACWGCCIQRGTLHTNHGPSLRVLRDALTTTW